MALNALNDLNTNIYALVHEDSHGLLNRIFEVGKRGNFPESSEEAGETDYSLQEAIFRDKIKFPVMRPGQKSTSEINVIKNLNEMINDNSITRDQWAPVIAAGYFKILQRNIKSYGAVDEKDNTEFILGSDEEIKEKIAALTQEIKKENYDFSQALPYLEDAFRNEKYEAKKSPEQLKEEENRNKEKESFDEYAKLNKEHYASFYQDKKMFVNGKAWKFITKEEAAKNKDEKINGGMSVGDKDKDLISTSLDDGDYFPDTNEKPAITIRMKGGVATVLFDEASLKTKLKLGRGDKFFEEGYGLAMDFFASRGVTCIKIDIQSFAHHGKYDERSLKEAENHILMLCRLAKERGLTIELGKEAQLVLDKLTELGKGNDIKDVLQFLETNQKAQTLQAMNSKVGEKEKDYFANQAKTINEKSQGREKFNSQKLTEDAVNKQKLPEKISTINEGVSEQISKIDNRIKRIEKNNNHLNRWMEDKGKLAKQGIESPEKFKIASDDKKSDIDTEQLIRDNHNEIRYNVIASKEARSEYFDAASNELAMLKADIQELENYVNEQENKLSDGNLGSVAKKQVESLVTGLSDKLAKAMKTVEEQEEKLKNLKKDNDDVNEGMEHDISIKPSNGGDN